MKKIRNQFLVTITIILILCFVTGVATIGFLAEKIMTDDFESNIKRTNSLIKQTSSSLLWNYNYEDLVSNVEKFFEDKSINSLIIESEGEIKAELYRTYEEEYNEKGENFSYEEDIKFDDNIVGNLKIDYTNKHLLENVRNIRLFLAISAIGIILAVGTIIFIITGKISSPIITATNFADKISKGELNVEKLNIKSKNETALLAGALNVLHDNLKTIIKEIAEMSKFLAISSEEFTSSGKQVSTTAEDVGLAIQNVASGAEEQLIQAEEVGKKTNILLEQINKIQENADMMLDSAIEVNSSIENGNKSVFNSKKQIGNMKDEITKASNIVLSLGESSKEIGEIIEIIGSVSKQTNLLALNAAIEAARAGEAGKGFSVVADEIRKLAEESSDATEQIAELIQKIQAEVDEAVEKMNSGVSEVSNSVKAIELTDNVFVKIKDVTLSLTGLVEQIAENSVVAFDHSRKVNESVEKIIFAGNDFAANAEEVAASSQEQIAITQNIINSSFELENTAKNLKNVVDNFKL
ncbi:MAG: methyl-accepting chemotaxis protein [archaeon]